MIRRITVVSWAIAAAMLCLSAEAQVSVGAKAAASAPGADNSANGGTGGVGLGGVGPGVGINPNVNAGAGELSAGRAVGNNALSGPRARRDAQRVLPPGVDTPEHPLTAGQRALALEAARKGPVETAPVK
jgi:hypothetical protein